MLLMIKRTNIRKMDHLGDSDDFLVRCIRFAQANVFFDGTGKEDGFLTDHTDVGSKPVDIQGFDLVTIEENSTTIGVVKTLYQLYDGTFWTEMSRRSR